MAQQEIILLYTFDRSFNSLLTLYNAFIYPILLLLS